MEIILERKKRRDFCKVNERKRKERGRGENEEIYQRMRDIQETMGKREREKEEIGERE